MTDQAATSAPAPAQATTAPVVTADPNSQELGLSDLTALYRQRRAAPAAPDAAQKPQEQTPAKAAPSAPAEPSDELSPEDFQEPDETPAKPASVKAPEFLNAEEREAFAQMPPESQQALLRLHATARRAQDKVEKELAEQTRAFAEQRAKVERERQYYAEQLGPIIEQVRSSIDNEFPDITSVVAVQKMAAEDPARWARWQAKQQALQLAQFNAQQQHQAAAAQAAERHADYVRKEMDALVKAVPAWADEGKRMSGLKEVRDYLSSAGYRPERLDSLSDHVDVVTARKAMLYDRAMSAKMSALRTPKSDATVKAAPTRGDGSSSAKLDAMKATAAETGKVDDVAAFYKARRERMLAPR